MTDLNLDNEKNFDLIALIQRIAEEQLQDQEKYDTTSDDLILHRMLSEMLSTAIDNVIHAKKMFDVIQRVYLRTSIMIGSKRIKDKMEFDRNRPEMTEEMWAKFNVWQEEEVLHKELAHKHVQKVDMLNAMDWTFKGGSD